MKRLQLITISLLFLSACGKQVERDVYVIPESKSVPAISKECKDDGQQWQQQQQQTSAGQIRECVWSRTNLS
jgi:uncharacterized lipoprotein YmbA